MSSYGKILDGRLTLQHGVVNYDGKNIINPSDEILRKLGWYPVKSDVQLPPKEGFMIVESYMLVEEQVTDEGTIPSHILIKYAYEALPPVMFGILYPDIKWSFYRIALEISFENLN